MPGAASASLLDDPGAHRLVAGDLEAVLLPGHGMLGASLRHRGEEILRRVDNLAAAAAKGSTAGIPLLHPWANRLAGLDYRAAGREVSLDPSSPLLHFDDRGLPMHGVPWPLLAWEVIEAQQDRLVARLDWITPDLLAVFPFRHRLNLAVVLSSNSLIVETTLIAGSDGPVPVCFGFHPYFGLAELPRAEWRLRLPAMQTLVLDDRGIPSGAEEPFSARDEVLDDAAFDDGFRLLEERASFSLAGASRRITLELLAGFPYAQIFAPKGQNFVALEPMSAPANALRDGRGLRLVQAGLHFRAAFRICIDANG